MAFTTYSGLLTAHASANTKGAYTQLTASTPYASSRIWLQGTSATTTRKWFLVDLATGAASSETVIVSNVFVHMGSDAIASALLPLTVDIAAGTRLAARCQSATGSSVMGCAVYLEDRALGSVTAPATYGALTALGRGTQIDPGAVASTKSAYVEITASTTAAHEALIVCVAQGQGPATNYAGFLSWQIDIATGAAGAETVLLPDLGCAGNANDDRMTPPIFGPFAVTIAAGTRLAARASCSGTNSAERVIALTLIGMDEIAAAGSGGEHAHTFIGGVL